MDVNTLRDLILAGVGLILSVGFNVIPPLARWYQSLKDWKGLVMILFDAVAAGAIYGFSCLQMFSFVGCDKAGLMSLLTALAIVIGSNQVTYLAVPSSKATLDAKAALVTKG